MIPLNQTKTVREVLDWAQEKKVRLDELIKTVVMQYHEDLSKIETQTRKRIKEIEDEVKNEN